MPKYVQVSCNLDLGGEMAHESPASELLVNSLCERSFLKLWTHPNPLGKKGKELCDCLIVCGPHVIIVSVKEIVYKDTGDITGQERWERDAIQKSVDQIFGAERWLNTADEVVRRDGRVVTLPPKPERQYHRISVSLGGRGQVPLRWGDFGHGFVHVCDEYTIADFVQFLSASEELIAEGVLLLLSGGGIEDLVALYLSFGRSFDLDPESDEQPDTLILADDLWKDFSVSERYMDIQKELRHSYVWDRMIENFARDLLSDGMFDMHSKQVTKDELALVTMALQPRGHRAGLAEAFIELCQEQSPRIAARVVGGHNHTAFVFLLGPTSDRERRAQELGLRCFVVRGRLPEVITVVGIATDKPGTSDIGYSSDIAYLRIGEWTNENEQQVSQIQEEIGLFRNIRWTGP